MFTLLLVTAYLEISFGADVSCDNLWAAMNVMQNGIDLVTFDLFGEHPGWSTLPLLKYTCNKGLPWTNPINNVKYDLPDQFAQAPISIPYDVTVATEHQTTKTRDEKRYMSGSITDSYLFGMFSKTKTLSSSYRVITADTRIWGTLNSSVSSFRVNFVPYEIAPNLIQLSDNAANYIYTTIQNKAPTFNESTIDLYEQFFEYFGTHFFSEAFTGGVFHLRYETDKYLLYEMTAEQISEQGQASFFNFLLKKGAVSGGQKQIDARFSAMTTIYEICYGGSFCPSSSSTYDEWQISVASTPWIVSGSFIPMDILIYNNTQISNSFKAAIFNHIQISYLQNEILTNIADAKSKVAHSINQTATYGETVACACPSFGVSECIQGASCKSYMNKYIFTPSNQYHSYVNNNLQAFHSKLASVQQQLTQKLNLIENNTNLLLKSGIVNNQTLFNLTASMWEDVMDVLQTNSAWDLCKWVNTYDCCGTVCVKMPCSGCQVGCHQPVTFNLTYFSGLISLI
eukprot:304550_1